MKSVLVDKYQTPFLATLLSEFRGVLEIENGGPLTDGDPTVAFLLSDLADFLGLAIGERAVALGTDVLVYLNRLDYNDVSDRAVIVEMM